MLRNWLVRGGGDSWGGEGGLNLVTPRFGLASWLLSKLKPNFKVHGYSGFLLSSTEKTNNTIDTCRMASRNCGVMCL